MPDDEVGMVGRPLVMGKPSSSMEVGGSWEYIRIGSMGGQPLPLFPSSKPSGSEFHGSSKEEEKKEGSFLRTIYCQ